MKSPGKEALFFRAEIIKQKRKKDISCQREATFWAQKWRFDAKKKRTLAEMGAKAPVEWTSEDTQRFFNKKGFLFWNKKMTAIYKQAR